jgi:hypothetical protein
MEAMSRLSLQMLRVGAVTKKFQDRPLPQEQLLQHGQKQMILTMLLVSGPILRIFFIKHKSPLTGHKMLEKNSPIFEQKKA